MKRLANALAVTLVACAPAAVTAPVTAAQAVAERPRDCPDEPAIELEVRGPEGAGEPLRVGGHITDLITSRDDSAPLSLVGTLDTKGTLAFERVTRALALDNYAATARGAPPRRLTLTLRGDPIAELEVTTALRGRRFRLPVRTDLAPPFTDDTADALDRALRVDRRCFPGR